MMSLLRRNHRITVEWITIIRVIRSHDILQRYTPFAGNVYILQAHLLLYQGRITGVNGGLGMRQRFDTQLMEVKKKIVEMSNLVHKAIEQSVLSLKLRDLEMAEIVIKNDELINSFEREIEQLSTHLVATHQPYASDLRRLVANYKIIASLERMGDLAVDIAKISIRIGNVPVIKPLIDLPKMTEIVIKMIHTAVKAFTEEDVALARSLAEMDHEVDRLYNMIFTELNEMMVKDPAVAAQGVYLLLTTRYLERIGDYCTNIGEEVIYMELGLRENLNQ